MKVGSESRSRSERRDDSGDAGRKKDAGAADAETTGVKGRAEAPRPPRTRTATRDGFDSPGSTGGRPRLQLAPQPEPVRASGMRAFSARGLQGAAPPAATYRASSTSEAQGRNPASLRPEVNIDQLQPVAAGQPGSLYQSPFTVAGNAQVAGRLGVHWPVHFDVHNPQQVDAIIERASALGAGYTTLNIAPGDYARDREAFKALFAKLNNHVPPITPVVRIYEGKAADQWGQEDINRMRDAAVQLAQDGVKLIQIGNEPNIETKLRERMTPEEAGWVSRLENREISMEQIPQAIRDSLWARRQQFHADSIPKQVAALEQVKGALTAQGLDAQLGMPPMAAGSGDTFFTFAPEKYFADLAGAVGSRERDLPGEQHLVDWIATHTYSWNDADPADPSWNGQFPHDYNARGHLGWGPATSHQYEEIARNLLGRDMRALSTEGGAGPDYFRPNPAGQLDIAGAKRALSENYAQLHDDPSLTGCLWLDWEADPVNARDAWNRSVLNPVDPSRPDEYAWATVLPDYREAYQRARGG